jgi:mannose-6-phosphate isomerase-like protein (cupin superfamily)
VQNADVVSVSILPGSETSRQFDGFEHGADVSLFFNRHPPGGGPRLHAHPYAETFVVEEGTISFTVGDATVEATAGTVVTVAANTPHKFVNVGTTPLRMISVHPVARMQTEWLE